MWMYRINSPLLTDFNMYLVFHIIIINSHKSLMCNEISSWLNIFHGSYYLHISMAVSAEVRLERSLSHNATKV